MSDIIYINPLIYTHQTEVSKNPETKTETSHAEISSPHTPVLISLIEALSPNMQSI
jgi:hypothetical protein